MLSMRLATSQRRGVLMQKIIVLTEIIIELITTVTKVVIVIIATLVMLTKSLDRQFQNWSARMQAVSLQ